MHPACVGSHRSRAWLCVPLPHHPAGWNRFGHHLPAQLPVPCKLLEPQQSQNMSQASHFPSYPSVSCAPTQALAWPQLLPEPQPSSSGEPDTCRSHLSSDEGPSVCGLCAHSQPPLTHPAAAAKPRDALSRAALGSSWLPGEAGRCVRPKNGYRDPAKA